MLYDFEPAEVELLNRLLEWHLEGLADALKSTAEDGSLESLDELLDMASSLGEEQCSTDRLRRKLSDYANQGTETGPGAPGRSAGAVPPLREGLRRDAGQGTEDTAAAD